MEFDKKYIKIAIFILKQIIGRTFPNPPVVCVLVEANKTLKDHKIVSFGFTAKTGRPHAEAEAIQNVNFKKNKKYILYSTLEPCCHIGRSESCVSRILKTKIDRVVFSIFDPDHRVNGGGEKKLKENGIRVVNGIMKDETYKLYEGYFFNRIKKRPKVILKLATSLDGKISFQPSARSKITNKMCQDYLHILRSEVDGILVGSNTVKIDDCVLNCRMLGLKKFSPIRIVLNRNLDLNMHHKIFKNCKNIRTLVFTQQDKKTKKKPYLDKKVEIISMNKKKFNLDEILRKLGDLGICNLLVEGGAKIFSSFLESNLCDEIYIFRGNFFIGSKGQSAIDSNGVCNFSKFKFKTKKIIEFGDNKLEILEKSNNKNFFFGG